MIEVAELPRRTAHAVAALLIASKDKNSSPLSAAEIMLYDDEATGPRATGNALAHARQLGLATYLGPWWIPSFAALELRHDLEDRYLRETAQDGEGD